LQLIAASLTDWQSDRRYDVITSVHGLHYIGDKLGLIGRACAWLTENGRFAANLDLKNVRLCDGQPARAFRAADLRGSGLQYDSRKKRVLCLGHKIVKLPVVYQGADDKAGPNYTGQAAVDSHYQWSR
jgi:hypothetical protein